MQKYTWKQHFNQVAKNFSVLMTMEPRFILKLFLNFNDCEPQYSNNLNSYKKIVYSSKIQVFTTNLCATNNLYLLNNFKRSISNCNFFLFLSSHTHTVYWAYVILLTRFLYTCWKLKMFCAKSIVFLVWFGDCSSQGRIQHKLWLLHKGVVITGCGHNGTWSKGMERKRKWGSGNLEIVQGGRHKRNSSSMLPC